MKASFEQALPPRERLELTVDDMFRTAELYDGAQTERKEAEDGGMFESLAMPGERATALFIREVDSDNIPQSYIVAVHDATQASQGIAGLAWRPQDILPPRVFDTQIAYDEQQEVTALLPEWLRAHASREDADAMPPNPFNPTYEAQEVTLGTLNNEPVTSKMIQRLQMMGMLAAYTETFNVLISPILPPAGDIWPE